MHSILHYILAKNIIEMLVHFVIPLVAVSILFYGGVGLNARAVLFALACLLSHVILWSLLGAVFGLGGHG
jgi:hypothetical protein